MTIELLRNAARARPFKPFTNCLGDGRPFFVGHPEFITMPPTASRTFVVAEPDENYRITDLPLVTSLDFKNGHDDRKK